MELPYRFSFFRISRFPFAQPLPLRLSQLCCGVCGFLVPSLCFVSPLPSQAHHLLALRQQSSKGRTSCIRSKRDTVKL